MAIDPANARKRDYAIGEISSSNLSAALKEDLTAVVASSAEATNGLTTREKLQAVSDNLFDISRLMALFIVAQGRRVATWKDVVIAFKWPITVVALGVLFLLALHPELAAFFRSLADLARPGG